jgi:hypothetical protein
MPSGSISLMTQRLAAHGAWSVNGMSFLLTGRRETMLCLSVGGVAPCDLVMLAKQTAAAQEALMAAFAKHAAKPGKADLMEPVLPPVPTLGNEWPMLESDCGPHVATVRRGQ